MVDEIRRLHKRALFLRRFFESMSVMRCYANHRETGDDLGERPVPRMKLMVAFVLMRIGLPLKRNGSHFHCFTASTAADQSSFGPLIACALSTSPVFPTTISTTTFPWIPANLADSGYEGSTTFVGFLASETTKTCDVPRSDGPDC